MYSCVGEAVFSSDILLQSSVSHDLSEIILICWFGSLVTITIIINVETVVLLDLLGTMTHFIQDSFGE